MTSKSMTFADRLARHRPRFNPQYPSTQRQSVEKCVGTTQPTMPTAHLATHMSRVTRTSQSLARATPTLQSHCVPARSLVLRRELVIYNKTTFALPMMTLQRLTDPAHDRRTATSGADRRAAETNSIRSDAASHCLKLVRVRPLLAFASEERPHEQLHRASHGSRDQPAISRRDQQLISARLLGG